MTDREQLSKSEQPDSRGIAISRRALVIGAIGLLLVVAAGAVGIGYALGAGNSSTMVAVASSPAVETHEPPTQAAVSTPTPEPEPAAETYGFGQPFVTGNVTLVVNSIEAVDSIETTEGSPIVPDEGGQLFLLRMTYSNSKTQADLSCGNTDLYLQAFDTLEREMAPVFELYRVPGNPGCNEHLLQDTPHEWNYVFQSVAGASPLALSVTETDKWLEPVWVDLQP